MKRLSRLEVYWSVLHLEQHVWCELAIERLKILVSCSGAVVTGLHVVDKCAPHYDAAMRCKRLRQHVCAVNVTAIVCSWTRLTFAVGFHEEATEIRNHFVNFVGLLFPPLNHRTIKRICRW